MTTRTVCASCGVEAALARGVKPVHLEPIPKGYQDHDAILAELTEAPPPREEAPLITEQVDTLKHLIAALALEDASPEDLGELIIAGVHLVNAAWTSSMARDFRALTDALTSWQAAMAAKEKHDGTQGD